MLQDVVDKADKWGDDGTAGRIDPFTEVYEVRAFLEERLALGLSLRLPLSASFRHDRPHDRMSRPDKERSRSQEDRRSVHEIPDQWHPRLLAPALVP